MAKSESEKALEYVQSRESEAAKKLVRGPCITISRESGAGSGIVDDILLSILNEHQIENTSKWAIFDRNLIERVLEDHNLPRRLAKLISDEKQSAITGMLSELLGLQPSLRTLIHKKSETILQLASMGNVIIVGGAGNLVTEKMTHCFNVRLVAPLENRINRIQNYYHFERKKTIEFVKNEDFSRKEYFWKNFHRNIDDPLIYHMILNTGKLSYEEAAHVIARAVMERFPETFKQSAVSSLQSAVTFS